MTPDCDVPARVPRESHDQWGDPEPAADTMKRNIGQGWPR